MRRAAHTPCLRPWLTLRALPAGELSDSLTELFMAEPATPAAEALAHVKSKKVEHHLPDQWVLGFLGFSFSA